MAHQVAPQQRRVETQVTDAITNKNWNRLAEVCESFELDAPNLDPPAVPLYSIHLAAYLIQNDLNNARFLWKRTPTDLKKAGSELAALWRIGQAMWNRNYDQLWPSLAGFGWSTPLVPLVSALGEVLRQRTFLLLSKSYSSISVEDAALFLGLTPKETTDKALAAGWTQDGNLLSPKPEVEVKDAKVGIEQLRQLTEYVVFLEQQ